MNMKYSLRVKCHLTTQEKMREGVERGSEAFCFMNRYADGGAGWMTSQNPLSSPNKTRKYEDS
jgi:hypothetical protein